jgi:hypothetical protein
MDPIVNVIKNFLSLNSGQKAGVYSLTCLSAQSIIAGKTLELILEIGAAFRCTTGVGGRGGATSFSIKTPCLTTFSATALSIKGLLATFSIKDTQHENTLLHHAECHYSECHYAEYRNTECRYAECRFAG